MSERPYLKPTGPIDPQPSNPPSEPFAENGDQHGAVPPLACASCGGLVALDKADILVVSDESGAMRLTAASDRGHVALLGTIVDVCITVDARDVGQYLDSFTEQGLVCARRGRTP